MLLLSKPSWCDRPCIVHRVGGVKGRREDSRSLDQERHRPPHESRLLDYADLHSRHIHDLNIMYLFVNRLNLSVLQRDTDIMQKDYELMIENIKP